MHLFERLGADPIRFLGFNRGPACKARGRGLASSTTVPASESVRGWGAPLTRGRCFSARAWNSPIAGFPSHDPSVRPPPFRVKDGSCSNCGSGAGAILNACWALQGSGKKRGLDQSFGGDKVGLEFWREEVSLENVVRGVEADRHLSRDGLRHQKFERQVNARLGARQH